VKTSERLGAGPDGRPQTCPRGAARVPRRL